jgi:hypothetical protein
MMLWTLLGWADQACYAAWVLLLVPADPTGTTVAALLLLRLQSLASICLLLYPHCCSYRLLHEKSGNALAPLLPLPLC